jgi:hypothetical protein
MEPSKRGTLLGVPAHLYRQALEDIFGWARAHVAGDAATVFQHEVRLRFFWGFFRTRRRDFFEQRRHARREEFEQLLPAGAARTRAADAIGGYGGKDPR